MTTTRSPQSISDLTPIAGPVDRVHFIDEQRRRRRQTWRFTLLCALAAALVGVPLAMFITPFLFFAILLALRLAQNIVTIPTALATTLSEFAAVAPTFLDTFANSPDVTLLGSLRTAFAATRFPLDSAPLPSRCCCYRPWGLCYSCG
jgi:hypothetical protein